MLPKIPPEGGSGPNAVMRPQEDEQVGDARFSDVLQKRLAVARGDEPADTVLSGGRP